MKEHHLDDLADDIIRRQSLVSKAIGVTFSQPIRHQAHIFEFQDRTRQIFHMWFIIHPIDIVYLDDQIIVDYHTPFLPFTAHRAKEPYDTAVELPHGTVREAQIDISDTLILPD